jgi:MFS family permease
MVGTIVPVVSGQAEQRRGRLGLFYYALGLLVGGVLVGLLLGWVGTLVRKAIYWNGLQSWHAVLLVGILAVLGGASEVKLLRVPAPQSRWQVPRTWLARWRYRTVLFLYGVVLGAGFLTPIAGFSFYTIVLFLIVVGPDLILGPPLVFAAFALARALPVAALTNAVESGGDMGTYLTEIGVLRTAVSVGNGMLSAGLGAFLLTGISIWQRLI